MTNTQQTVNWHLPRWGQFLFAALFPLLYTLIWLYTNHQLPVSDATDYLGAGFASYRHLTDHGLWHGLTHFQLIRGWRPIFFSVISVPFFWLSHGDAFIAYEAVALLAMAASVVYLYLLFRLRLSQWSAIAATNLIMLLPFVQMPILSLFAESILFPCVFGSLYHLIQSSYLRNKSHTVGFILCFSLALLVRPVDALMLLCLPLIVFLATGWRQRLFTLPQLTGVLIVALLSVFLFLSFAVAHFVDHAPFHPIDGGTYDLAFSKTLYHLFIAAIGCVMLSIVLIIRLKQTSLATIARAPVVWVFALSAVITLIWYLPYAFATLLWVYRTSLGDLAAVYAGAHPRLPASTVLWMFIQQEGVMAAAGVCITALLSLLLLTKQERRDTLLSWPFIYVMLLIPIPVWEVLSTVQSAARKLSIAFPACFIVLLFIALQRGRWMTLRWLMIVSVLIFQCVVALNGLFPGRVPFATLASKGGDYPVAVTIQPNPHDVVMQFLSTAAARFHLKRIDIESNVERSLPVDVFLLHLQEQLTRQPYQIHYPYFSTYIPLIVQQLSQNTDAVFLTDGRDRMQVSEKAANAYLQQLVTEPNPILKTLYTFLYDYSRQQLSAKGWASGPCLVFTAADQQEYLGCLLISKKRDLPVTNFSGEIAV